MWWDGKRHLAPLLDSVNADSIDNPQETRPDVSTTKKLNNM
jgi:hypothetical protein